MHLVERARRLLAILLAAACAPFAWAQADTPTGPVPPGTLQLVCDAPSCTVALPGIGPIDIAGDRARVIGAFPGGTHRLSLTTPTSTLEASFTMCGGTTVVVLTADGIETTSDACAATGVVVVRDADDRSVLRVDGETASVDDLGRAAVYAGEREIVVERPGFEVFSTRVFVGEGERVEIEVTSARLPGSLVLSGDLLDARIFVDGELRVNEGRVAEPTDDVEIHGDSVRIPVAAGLVSIRVERDGYQTLETTLTVESETETAVPIELAPLPASLTLLPFPEDARVTIDGRVVATGRPISLAAGVHDLAAEASGFEPFRRQIEVAPGATADLTFEMVGRPVTLRVRGVPALATVTVDGGEPISAAGAITVRPGRRELVFGAPGYAPLTRQVVVTTELLQTITVDLQRLGVLDLRSLPASARVTIDGDTYGASEGVVQLPPGSYEVAVEADGYEPARSDLVLAPGEQRLLDLDLVPLPATITIPGVPVGVQARLDDALTPIRDETIGPIQPGSYELTLESDIHKDITVTVDLEPGEAIVLSDLEFAFRPAQLVLIGAPQGTRVKVDDADVITYEGPVEIEPGERVVWIAADDFGRYRITIDVGPGEQATVPVEFE